MGVAHEFVMALHHRPRSWLPLANPFARAMEGSRPLCLWLFTDVCYVVPAWVAVDLSPCSVMFLMWGWKSLAHSLHLRPDHLLQFKFDGASTPSVKFFGTTSSRLECYTESSSGSNLDSSSKTNNNQSSLNLKTNSEYSE
ncbi:hypothetical protein D1007_13955 [Hordeum vulgare]|nr:hypothetical protein D1007_13955 [Hordeum vulgare]